MLFGKHCHERPRRRMDCGQDLFGDGSGLWIRLHDPGVVCHMSCLSVEGLEDDCLGVPLLLRIGNVYFELLLLLGMQGWVHIQYWGRIFPGGKYPIRDVHCFLLEDASCKDSSRG